ncbi:MAG: putative heparinase superfamily protein [Oleispira sp.]|jgi:uncharacterized heparinase superfamily protein
MKLLTYFHTLKYVKFSQIYYRIVKRFTHPSPNEIIGELAECSGSWVCHSLYEQKLYAGNRVRFLNQDGDVNKAYDWNSETHTKLWLYNLHYFDDLNADGSSERAPLQLDLLKRWIDENPAALGNGWEPYPTSLRIVNWVKAFLSGISTDQAILSSLAKQAGFLSQDLERHILGNHLFVNAKALIFSGTYLQGKDADSWLKTGLDIYVKELDEQVLPDGGNFELTPMYHVIMLVDLLDLINLWTAYPKKVNAVVVEKTKQVAIKMLGWLNMMSHNDGSISFFNDSAFGIAPTNPLVFAYAAKLGIHNPLTNSVYSENLTLFDLQNSGYVSVKSDGYSLIADLAHVGPSYQPGHAHADTLSYEFSLGKQRVLVNSGISEYGLNEERLRQRKTAAHNTVVVNNLDSSQVWSGFRVAKRASVLNRLVNPVVDNRVHFSAAHNGFKKQGVNCIHHRDWFAENSSVIVTDKLIGNYINAVGYLHLHPEIEVLNVADEQVLLTSRDYDICMKVSGAIVSIENTTWHPGFGLSIDNKKLNFLFVKTSMSIAITWQKK